MTTFTKEQLIEIIKRNITVMDRYPDLVTAQMDLEVYKIALASLEAEPVAVNDDMAYAFHHALSDSSLGADEVEEIKAGLRAAFANVTIQPEPVAPDEIALAIENLKQKLVECNHYNYCADAVKGVEDACRAVSYSQADNQPASGNQAAESNRGNEWTGNPDIDNAIIMLDRIDTAESCDDDRIEAVKAVLRRLAGNYPDIPDSSVPAPGKGVTGERIRIKPHVYRELVNRLHDTAVKCAGTQQLRERISRVLGDVITPDHHKQAEKSDLERCHLEAALNIKPGHTLGIIDALLVHKMARALLPLVADKHEAGHANES